ncbi:MAG: hypothetical protein KA764_15510 [Anaerolineales bacterium]|nr:hypothetical protein [Anaerolineales bacterium]
MLRHVRLLVWLTIIIGVSGLAVALSAPPAVQAARGRYVSLAGDDGIHTNMVVSAWDGRTTTVDLPIDASAYTYIPLCANQYCPPNFFDDFSNPTSGWSIDEDDFARSEYLDNEYRILSKQSGYSFLYHAPTCARQNYVVETDARWVDTPGSSYGLLFGMNSDFSQYYIFDINTDYQMYRLYRHDNGGFTRLAAPTATAVIQRGTAGNYLKVSWNGGLITLQVNTIVVGFWPTGPVWGLTQAGVMVSSYDDVPAADARFDNFRVTDLGGSGVPGLDTAAMLGGLNSQPAVVTHAGLPAWPAAAHPLTARPTAVSR